MLFSLSPNPASDSIFEKKPDNGRISSYWMGSEPSSCSETSKWAANGADGVKGGDSRGTFSAGQLEPPAGQRMQPPPAGAKPRSGAQDDSNSPHSGSVASLFSVFMIFFIR